MMCLVPEEKGYFSVDLPRDVQPFCVEDWIEGSRIILLGNPESSLQEKQFLYVELESEIDKPDKLIYIGMAKGGYVFEVK